MNLNELAKALGCSRQRTHQLAHEPGFPYLKKPRERGATRWDVDAGQVRRWLEQRDEERELDRRHRIKSASEDMLYRKFWVALLRRGYQPEDIARIRDKCMTVSELRERAKRMRIEL
jgi:hypothetical protein